MENIDILSEACSKELAPYLTNIIYKRPVFFKEKRDRLRVKSLEFLVKIDSQEIESLLSYLLKDENKRIRELALEFKAKDVAL